MFNQIPENTFREIQLNAGILLEKFDPNDATLILADIIGATSGGVAFSATPETTDFGEDIDNAAKGMKELMQLGKWTVELSGTFITVNPNIVKKLIGAADITTTNNVAKITPRSELQDSDFADIWWVGDYSNVKGESVPGFIAIHMLNSLSTGGFSTQSTDNGKGTFEFTFAGHYSISDQTRVPFEVFVQSPPATPPQEEGELNETI